MAEMTVLQIVQEFSTRQGLPKPLAVTAATDDTVQQILGMLNEGIADLADNYEWQQLQNEASFFHAGGAANQAIVFNTTYPDFKALIPETLWDSTGQLPVLGPLGPAQWAALLVRGIQPAQYSYALAGGALKIYPTPSPLTSITFTMSYLSRHGVYDPVSSATTELYTTDTSYPKLPSGLILADLKWRWRKEKGLPYAEDQRTCEEMKVNLVGREDQGRIQLDDQEYTGPGVIVPAGNWSVP